MLGLSRREIILGALGKLRDVVRQVGDVDTMPVLQRVSIPVRGLDRRLDGMRIAQLSDVHIGMVLPLEYLRGVVALLERDPPEMLTVTGDLLDDPTLSRGCFDIMSRVRAPHGHYYVLGNHENFRERERIVEVARRHPHFKVLINESLPVRVQGALVNVSGVDFPVGQRASAPRDEQNAAFVAQALLHCEDADFRLCLAHHPDDFDEIRRRGVELTLSGHTHGGQIAPVGPWVSHRLFKYVRGLYRETDSHLYVSTGTGHTLPVRVGVPTEVTVLTLHRV
ncbi:MAG: metallophosphoesterase [Myxococcota bacterium]